MKSVEELSYIELMNVIKAWLAENPTQVEHFNAWYKLNGARYAEA